MFSEPALLPLPITIDDPSYELMEVTIRAPSPRAIVRGLRFFNGPGEYWIERVTIREQAVIEQKIDVAFYSIDTKQGDRVIDQETINPRLGEPPRFVRVDWPLISQQDPLLMRVRLQELFSDPPRLNGICVVEACPPYPWI